MSGGNILVPIVAHIFYDFLTFVEVHQRATAQLQLTLKGDIPQEQLVRAAQGGLLCNDRSRKDSTDSCVVFGDDADCEYQIPAVCFKPCQRGS